MGAGEIRAGKAYVELATKDGKLKAGLRAAGAQLKGFGVAAGKLGLAAAAVAAAVSATGLKAFMDYGDQLDKMRQRTGLSVKTLSELDHAAEQSGTSLETVEKAVRKMQVGITDGDKDLESLGLNLADLQAMSPEQQFDAVAKAVGSIADPTERAAAAYKAFGKSGTEILPMIEDLDALRKEADEMGFTMSGPAAANAVRLGDQLSNLWKTVRFAAMAIGEMLTPILLKIIPIVQSVATSLLKGMQSIRDAIVGGNLALAGQIVLQALQVSMLSNVQMLSDAVGGEFGDFIGSLGSQLAQGDLLGAWKALLGGLTSMFSAAMKGVLKAWRDVTSEIADWILKNAAKGGFLGKLALLGTGVDMQAEVERGKRLNARLGIQGDPLAEAQKSARDQISAQADAAMSVLDELDKNFGNNAVNGGGRERANKALEDAKKALADLRAQAKSGAPSDLDFAKTGIDLPKGASEFKSSVAGTFNSSIVAGLGASSPLDRTAKATEQTAKHTKKLADQKGAPVFTS